MTATRFASYGYEIDLGRLYRAMYEQSVVESGQRVFHGNSPRVRSVKRLLHELFGVPVRDNVHPVNHAIRKEAENRFRALGWAAKDVGRSGRYVLHRDLDRGTESFLLTWNPSRFPWAQRADVIRRTTAGEPVADDWSVGSRTSGVAVGDRVYLVRLGNEPRGIVASGTVTSSEVDRRPHWDRTPGKMTNYVNLQWERAVDDSELLSIATLAEQIPSVKWTPQGSGVQLRRDEAERLADLWGQEVGPSDTTDPTDRRQAREAGYLADSVVRAAIERHAEDVAATHYKAAGYTVVYVGAFRSYDLHLIHGQTGEERHVEVKGSAGPATTVELTAGEVAQARAFQPTDLFVVSEVSWTQGEGAVETSGGIARPYASWTPAEHSLAPVRYRYTVPSGDVGR